MSVTYAPLIPTPAAPAANAPVEPAAALVLPLTAPFETAPTVLPVSAPAVRTPRLASRTPRIALRAADRRLAVMPAPCWA